MKKLILLSTFIAALSVSTANASMNYECWKYKNGKPYKMTNITANSKSEAERKGNELGGYSRCQ